jgi:hypothetical protein
MLARSSFGYMRTASEGGPYNFFNVSANTTA